MQIGKRKGTEVVTPARRGVPAKRVVKVIPVIRAPTPSKTGSKEKKKVPA